MYYDIYHIKINFKGQVLNQANILKTKVYASLNDKDREITILKVRDYFRTNRIKFL